MLLDGPVSRLLDEWQTSPVLWNHVRREVDERHAAGQFLLTGSAIPVDDTTRHSIVSVDGAVEIRNVLRLSCRAWHATSRPKQPLTSIATDVSGGGTKVSDETVGDSASALKSSRPGRSVRRP